MLKQIICIVVIGLMCLNLSACEKYNAIQTVDDDGDEITYNNELYIKEKHGFWNCNYENLTEIAWVWFIPIIGKSSFYSDEQTNPDFIYSIRGGNVWISENYDYKSEKFIIESTDLSYVFSESFDETETYDFSYQTGSIADFTWYPESHKELKNFPEIFLENGKYYIRFAYNEIGYHITDSFLNVLLEAGIIE